MASNNSKVCSWQIKKASRKAVVNKLSAELTSPTLVKLHHYKGGCLQLPIIGRHASARLIISHSPQYILKDY